MRSLLPMLLALVTCSVDPTLPVTAAVQSIDPAQTADVLVVPEVTVVARALSRRVLIVGDSEACTVGYYARPIVERIDREVGHPLDVIDLDCKGGTVVPYWAQGGNFRLALSRHPRPDVVLIFLGTNHYWNERDVPDASIILDQVRAQGLECLWVGNTAVKGRHWRVNEMLRAEVTPTCSYFDTEVADIPLYDGVHPDKVGVAKWLRAIWPNIPERYEEG